MAFDLCLKCCNYRLLFAGMRSDLDNEEEKDCAYEYNTTNTANPAKRSVLPIEVESRADSKKIERSRKRSTLLASLLRAMLSLFNFLQRLRRLEIDFLLVFS